jgi:PTS system mannose-specific IID component
LVRLFLRSFLFQSLWSFQRMQNVGWLFSLWPVFRRLYADPAERARAAQAHADYFNTHPYTADIILGVVAAMEERCARDASFDRGAILAAKKVMSGPLSALGETVFWATLRPLLLVVAVTAGALSPRSGWIWAPALYLLFFNAIHVGVKAGGLAAGYKRGLDVAVFLSQWPLQRWSVQAAWLGLGLAAGALAVLVSRSSAPWTAFLLAAVSLAVLRRRRTALFLPFIAAAAGFLSLF